MQYRADIDGLRAVAVLPVVLYHAGLPGLSGGFVGVDVFFVISGFLITSIISQEIKKETFSLVRFYERRARRILPALVVMLFTTIFVGWFILLPAEMERLGRSAIATTFFLSNVYFTFSLDYFSQKAEFEPLLHTWSLAVEEQFYIIFPLLLVFLNTRHWNRAIWVVATLSLVSLTFAVIALPLEPDAVFYLIVFRAWELGAGAILALSSLSPPNRASVRGTLACLGLVAILVPVFVYQTTTPFPAMAALPPVMGASIVIWTGAHKNGNTVSSVLGHPVLVFFGLISYSLYLWHWPILTYLRVTFGTVLLPLGISLAAVCVSIFLAWLSYRFVERPFRSKPPSGLTQRTVFKGSGLSGLTILVIGGALIMTEGFPNRLPTEVVRIASYINDRNDRRETCFGRSVSDGFCLIGKQPETELPLDFLLWGDSHADAFMPGVDVSALNAGITGAFAGHTACPPMLDVRRKVGGQKCAKFNNDVINWLESQNDVPLVILAARWTLSVEGTRYLGEAGKNISLEWTGIQEGFEKPLGNAEIVEAGLKNTITRILSTGRDVILLGSVPEVGKNVPLVVARKALLGWAPEVQVSFDEFISRAEATENLLSRIANSSERIQYIPLFDFFCDEEMCRVTNDTGQPLYVDDDHISKTAATELHPKKLNRVFLQKSNRTQ